jgi:hypothetical protein
MVNYSAEKFKCKTFLVSRFLSIPDCLDGRSGRNIMKPILGNLMIGLSIFFAINATATVRYVDLNCTNATPPCRNESRALRQNLL